MQADKDLEDYINSFGAKVPEEWFLWWNEHTKGYLVLNRDSKGQPFGHMIDDDRYNDRLVEYLRARGARVVSGVDEIEKAAK